MEQVRERIEDFMRRYGVLRVLAVAAVVLLVLLLTRRRLRVLSVVVVPALIGAILVVSGWLLLGPAGTQPSVDRNDVVWACGRKVLAEDRVFVEGMRKDCGIFGPQAEGERDVRPYDGPH